MKKLKVCYLPFSKNHEAPGDRRRVVFWARLTGHELTSNLNEKCDVIILSERSNFRNPLIQKNGAPVILDLIDGYLSPTSLIEDTLRGIAKKIDGQISGPWMRFSKEIELIARTADAVVCSSIEQSNIISRFNLNTHVILDAHSEIPFQSFRKRTDMTKHLNLFWEGLPYTSYGLSYLNPALVELNKKFTIELNCVTDAESYRVLGKYWRVSTKKSLDKKLKIPSNQIKLFPWSATNLSSVSSDSHLAVLPLNTENLMQRLKPENRLLIMWRLGLPCVTSDSPAYIRLSEKIAHSFTCHTTDDWLQNIQKYMNFDLAQSQVTKGQEYLREYHNDEVLIGKWNSAINSVL